MHRYQSTLRRKTIMTNIRTILKHRHGMNQWQTLALLLGALLGAILPICFIRLLLWDATPKLAWAIATIVCLTPIPYPICLYGLATGTTVTMVLICITRRKPTKLQEDTK